MVEPRHRLDFTLKPLQRRRRIQNLRLHHLQRHHSLHSPVLCLEHIPHAAVADSIEQHIVPQHQLLALRLTQPRRLKARQLPSRHQHCR